MYGFPFYFIDVEGAPDNYKFILRDPTGQIISFLENSKEIAQNVKSMVHRLVYSNYGTLSVATSYFEDHDALIYAFFRFVYTILLEQYLSMLYESKGIRIQYPDQNTYLIVLYKLYKLVANPTSTLDLQEFAVIINPLIGKVSWEISDYDIIHLFKIFLNAYYKVINYKKKVRIGLNPYINSI